MFLNDIFTGYRISGNWKFISFYLFKHDVLFNLLASAASFCPCSSRFFLFTFTFKGLTVLFLDAFLKGGKQDSVSFLNFEVDKYHYHRVWKFFLTL